jgi:hypothetical protein
MKHPCTNCGSRDWPRHDTSCPLCRAEPEDSDDSYDALFDDTTPDTNALLSADALHIGDEVVAFGAYRRMTELSQDFERKCAQQLSILREVLDYRQGKGRFDLSGLAEDERNNEAHDLWQEVENRIREALR